MRRKIKICFIQHASEVSGSLMSLFYTIEGLRESNEFEITVLCKSKEITEWYIQKGISATYLPSIHTFGHCSGHTYNLLSILDIFKMIKNLFILPISIFKQIKILQNIECDFIHLNSSTLLSSAFACKILNKKFFWHIREVLANGNFGIRKYLFSKIYLMLPTKLVCISEVEAKAISKKENNKFLVVYNFVSFDSFQNISDRNDTLKKLKLDPNKEYIITLGGTNPIKATSQLLRAIIKTNEKIHIIIAGNCNSYLKFKSSLKVKLTSILKILLGSYPLIEYWKLMSLEKDLKGRIHLVGPVSEVQNLIHCSKALYFGYTIPHFPRPAYEAWFLNRPVLSFENEIIESHLNIENSLLSRQNDANGLRENIKKLDNENLVTQIVRNGHLRTINKFDLSKNIDILINAYKSQL